MESLDRGKVVICCSVCNKKLLELGTKDAGIIIKCPRCKVECQVDIRLEGEYLYRSETINLSHIAENQMKYSS